LSSQRVVVATLGDSITEGSPEYDSRRGGDEQSQWQYWAARSHPDLEFRNFGIYGQRTDEIAARLDDAARGADALVVQGGINDIAQGRDIETAAGNLRGMVRRATQLGLPVALANVLPWNNGSPGHAAEIRRLNALVDDIGRHERVPVLRFFETLQDPRDPDRMAGEWTHPDGDHPSVAGYRRLGELAFLLPR
jgi:lysophospholipase L1-like esterase